MKYNKNTLWTFGDSFTYGFMCREKNSPYLKFKKENDDIWPNLLSKMFNYEVQNFGKIGASNDFILDSIIQNYKNIKQNDLVVIGKTIYGRNNFPKNNDWIDISSYLEIQHSKSWWNPYIENIFNQKEIETIIDFQYYFADNILYEKRQNERFEFIKEILINNKKVKNCYIWNIKDEKIKNIQKISEDTKNKINDYHFSFKGHLDFAVFLKKELKKEEQKYLL